MPKKHLLFLSFVAAGLAGCEQHSARPLTREDSSIAAGEIGSRLPEFSITDFQGRSLSAAELRGKVVLIDFWATWCAPCKIEMPGYQMLMERYGARGLVVVGLKVDIMKDAEDPVQFAKGIEVHYRLAVANDDLRQKFGGINRL